jgi:hypothetical protein
MYSKIAKKMLRVGVLERVQIGGQLEALRTGQKEAPDYEHTHVDYVKVGELIAISNDQLVKYKWFERAYFCFAHTYHIASEGHMNKCCFAPLRSFGLDKLDGEEQAAKFNAIMADLQKAALAAANELAIQVSIEVADRVTTEMPAPAELDEIATDMADEFRWSEFGVQKIWVALLQKEKSDRTLRKAGAPTASERAEAQMLLMEVEQGNRVSLDAALFLGFPSFATKAGKLWTRVEVGQSAKLRKAIALYCVVVHLSKKRFEWVTRHGKYWQKKPRPATWDEDNLHLQKDSRSDKVQEAWEKLSMLTPDEFGMREALAHGKMYLMRSAARRLHAMARRLQHMLDDPVAQSRMRDFEEDPTLFYLKAEPSIPAKIAYLRNVLTLNKDITDTKAFKAAAQGDSICNLERMNSIKKAIARRPTLLSHARNLKQQQRRKAPKKGILQSLCCCCCGGKTVAPQSLVRNPDSPPPLVTLATWPRISIRGSDRVDGNRRRSETVAIQVRSKERQDKHKTSSKKRAHSDSQ